MNEEPCCGNCAFFTDEFFDEQVDIGECIRFPPTITEHNVINKAKIYTTRFPLVSYVRICGEWRPK